MTLNICWQILVGIALLLIAVAPKIIQRCNSEKYEKAAVKKSEEAEEESKEASADYKGLGFSIRDLISCLLFTIGVLFICNGLVQYASELGVTIQSPLKYSDTILLLGTVFPTICVAYFQHQTQKKLNELNAIESKALSKKHEKEFEQAERWHMDELRSKAIQSFHSYSQVDGFVINFNLGQAQTNPEYKKEYVNNGCYISLGDDERKCLFCPNYYHINRSSVRIKTDNKDVDVDTPYVSSKRLSFFISNQQIAENNLYQLVRNSFSESLSDCESILQIEISLHGEDRSIRSDSNYLALNYSILLKIKSTSGYDNMGRFRVIAHSIELSQL